MCKFRTLRADEIDVRVATVVENKGFSLLLYKDARCDMNILDETIGSMNWQRTHTRENANCIVSIWDKEKNQWISKEDTGTESNTEKEKGLASDSFKRACFNWGIGRELYTSPFIWVSETKYISINKRTGKPQVNERFKVSMIETSADKVITALEIQDSKGNVVFSTKKKVVKQEPKVLDPKPKTENVDNVEFATQEQIEMLKALGYKGSKKPETMTTKEADYYIQMGRTMKKGVKK